jgi:MSHA biogenesis protein MshJ
MLRHRQVLKSGTSMSKVSEMWQQWEDKFSALTSREKGMIGFVVIFVLTFGVFSLLVEPYLVEQTKLETRQKKAKSSYALVNNQIQQIKNELKKEPNKQVKSDIAALKVELANVESELEKVMTDYVAPEKMALQLTRLLRTSKDVRIVGMSVLPTEKIETNKELDLPEYYRHKFEVTVTGDYFSLMDFVKNVTVKSKQFGIKSLNYEVTEHPTAVMTLSLVTISDNANVIKL